VSLQDVFRELSVPIGLGPVDHGENDVEAREERRGQVDLFRDVLVLVEPPELRVGRGKHGTAGLEDRG